MGGDDGGGLSEGSAKRCIPQQHHHPPPLPSLLPIASRQSKLYPPRKEIVKWAAMGALKNLALGVMNKNGERKRLLA